MQDTAEQSQETQAPEIVAEPAKPKAEAIQLDDRGIYRIKTQADEYRVAMMLLRTGAVPSTFKSPEQVMMAIQALKSLGLNWRTALRQCGFNGQGAFIVYGDLELAVVRQSGLLEGIDEYLFTKNPLWRDPYAELSEVDKKRAAQVPNDQPMYLRRSMANGNVDHPVVGAGCRLKRKGEETVHESIFTVEDAKQAGLWGKTPTWKAYPSRMMQMRARGVAIRNTFSDVTQGLGGHEYDVEGIEYDKK